MLRSEHRILTTHVGSLIRPPALLAQIQRARQAGAADSELSSVRRAAVAEVVRRQAAVGIDILNDGEFSKDSWAAYILKRITGFEVRPHQPRPILWLGSDRQRFEEFFAATFPRAITGFATEACVGPIAYADVATLDEGIADLKAALAAVPGREGFMTAVAPASTAFDGVDEFYGDERAYIFAIAEALRTEYRHIHQAGLLLQVDDAVLANMYDYLVRRSPEEFRRWAQLRIDALNYALEGIPEDRVRYHVCFGSWHAPHLSDAPLEEIVEFVLQVRAGAYSIEAANPRHAHEWRVWQAHPLPKGRILIPGVVTHHTVTVEHPRLVADRILQFARIVGPQNVIAGTDCGFSQLEHVQRVHESIMWAKLEALVEGAAIASRELWGS